MNYHNNPVSLSAMPQIEDLNFQPLAKNYWILNVTSTLIGWLIVLLPLFVIHLFVDKLNLPIWIPLGLSVFAILFVILAYFSSIARGYVIRERDVLYKDGIWWQKRTGVSFKRIQHIDITHGPIERKLGLATIKFFTAGGSMADLRIPGLPAEHADQLRETILSQTGQQNEQD